METSPAPVRLGLGWLAAGQLAEGDVDGRVAAAAGHGGRDLLSWPGSSHRLREGRVTGRAGVPGHDDHVTEQAAQDAERIPFRAGIQPAEPGDDNAQREQRPVAQQA